MAILSGYWQLSYEEQERLKKKVIREYEEGTDWYPWPKDEKEPGTGVTITPNSITINGQAKLREYPNA